MVTRLRLVDAGALYCWSLLWWIIRIIEEELRLLSHNTITVFIGLCPSIMLSEL